MGPQEVNIVPIVQSITKYATTVTEPQKIKSILEEAYYLATTGRKGPVWIDIPLDVQATEIDVDTLVEFVVPKEDNILDEELINKAKVSLEKAKRPLILAGNGIKLAGASEVLEKLVKQLNIPFLLTWKSIDMVDYDNDNYFGCPGGMGHRYANFILQNCDCLLILGSRLDCSLTAFNHENFAPRARKIMVDIDETEINKMKMPLEVKFVADVKAVLLELTKQEYNIASAEREDWLKYCQTMKNKYPVVLPEYHQEQEYINTYLFVEELCKQLDENDVIVPESSGGAGEITYQALKVKKGQKIKNAAGLGSMGFGLPYALGACIANDKKRTILINGDGAFQLNIQELATIVQQNLPIKIFIWNNLFNKINYNIKHNI